MGHHKELPDSVKQHADRVGRLSRLSARATGKDERAAYLAGIFHDDGKATLPPELFDGREITLEEYSLIKEHAIRGYLDLKERMPFTGLCSGLHHEMSVVEGYGITLEDIPKELSFADLKKILDIATIVSIADFIDAYNTRTTSMGLGSSKKLGLKELLWKRYPSEIPLVTVMLELSEELYKQTT